MKTVSYKGYQASVEFEDETLFVKILHISDLLIAECDRASEVENVAQTLVDDYLETCKEIGREPELPFKGSFNVRMSPEQHRRVAMAAADMGLSLNAWICTAVTEKLDCNRLSDRIDGVISKKQSLIEVMTTPREFHPENWQLVANVAHEETHVSSYHKAEGSFFHKVKTREHLVG